MSPRRCAQPVRRVVIGAAAAAHAVLIIVVLLGKKPDEKPAFMSESTAKVIQRRGLNVKFL